MKNDHRAGMAIVGLLLIVGGCHGIAVDAETPPRPPAQHRAPAVDTTAEATPSEIAIPLDWKSLPQWRVMWERASYPNRLAVSGQTLVILEHRRAFAVSLESGTLQWDAPIDRDTDVVPACEGRVVLASPHRTRAVNVSTGEVLWERDVTLARRPLIDPWSHETLQSHGCRVIIVSPADGQPESRLVEIDAETGESRIIAQCGEYCDVLGVEEGYVYYRDLVEEFVVETGGQTRKIPGETQGSLGDLWGLGASESQGLVRSRFRSLVGLDPAGESTRWTRSELEVLGRTMSGALVFREGTLEWIDMGSGVTRWTLPVSTELRRSTRRVRHIAANSGRIALGIEGLPHLVALIDVATGTLEALRLPPMHAEYLEFVPGGLLISSDRGTALLSLDEGAPPLRATLSLEEDVSRSIAQLEPGDHHYHDRRSPLRDHPQGAGAARDWLIRLAPTVEHLVLPRFVRGTPQEKANLAPVVAALDSGASRSALESALLATIGEPTLERMVLRVELARSITHRLPDTLAEHIAESSLEWVPDRMPRGVPRGGCSASARRRRTRRCQEWRQYRAALATRDMLAARAGSVEAAARLERIFAPAEALERSRCVRAFPEDQRGPLLAAGRRMFQGRRTAIELRPHDGACRHEEGGVIREIGPVTFPDPEDLDFDIGPLEPERIAYVRRFYYCGPLCAEWGRYVVILVDGEWRVVGHIMDMIS